MTDKPEVNSDMTSEEIYLKDLQTKPFGTRFMGYLGLSGPGWLQGAITLGGGSLSGSLYLGVLAGFGLMWLQPLAMVMGIIMLSAIGYVSLSTGERPFDAINKHINPVLGWGWAIATMMANLVWCMPQFALGTAAIQQNLMPGTFGTEGTMTDFTSKLIIVSVILVLSTVIIWSYDAGGKGIKIFEGLLKGLVGLVVLCFFGVVVKMTFSGDGLAWGSILAGFIPDLSLMSKPSPKFQEALAATGTYSEFWSSMIVADQQKVMITAAATAVGINMTFLLPYSMLKKGWNKVHRELAIYDLAQGLFIPFLIATSCVVIASATQFHATPAVGFLGEKDNSGELIAPAGNLVGGYTKLIDKRLKEEMQDDFKPLADAEKELKKARKTFKKQPLKEGETVETLVKAELGKDYAVFIEREEKLKVVREAVPETDKRMAAMLVKRDAFNLASSLKELTGPTFSQYVFGIGVLGMAVSTIIILMLINGFVVCEIFNLPHNGTYHRMGCLVAGLSGAMGPFLWKGDAKLWLAIPTSMFAFVLLPIAYFTFLFMMNSKSLLGENRPKGMQRVIWNVLMGTAASLAGIGSLWSIKSSPYATEGFIALGAFVALATIVGVMKKPVSTNDSNE
ncbi:MAG: divalent metal cation transporter [Planctomycetaceae bacterium]|nr:divalent metal cation transporter [Planctomycetaceae bacterium]